MRETAGRGAFSSKQLDAHVLVMTLRQLLTAEELEQVALEELGVEPAVREALAEARKQFETALPGIKNMRDALMHFDEWSRGLGHGPQTARVRAGEALRDVARDYWGFGYNTETSTVNFGPYSIQIAEAEEASHHLSRAIYLAAREVDKRRVAERRHITVEALECVGVICDGPGAVVKISPGTDLSIWLSLDLPALPDEQERRALANRIAAALADVGLRLVAHDWAPAPEETERLARRESLHAEPAPQPG